MTKPPWTARREAQSRSALLRAGPPGTWSLARTGARPLPGLPDPAGRATETTVRAGRAGRTRVPLSGRATALLVQRAGGELAQLPCRAGYGTGIEARHSAPAGRARG
jgi:hypothetical protein